jgi:hypothetical protein
MNTKTMMVPGEVAAAIAAARPELLKVGKPRDMTAQEVAGMYEVLGHMIQQTFDAQRRVKALEAQLAQGVLLMAEVSAATLASDVAARAVIQALRRKAEDDEDGE